MATKQPVSANRQDIHLIKYQWLAMANGDDGAPLGSSIFANQANFADRSIQITGTLGVAGAVTWEGSNDGGVTYGTLNDAFGNALVVTALGVKQITECVELVRPRITAGDGTTSLNVYLFARKIYE